MSSVNKQPPEGLEMFSVGALPTNCYLMGEQYLVDPGGLNQTLKERLEQIEDLQAIVLTHTHWDHIDGIGEVLEMFPKSEIYCHSREFEMLQDPSKNFSSMQGNGVSYEADSALESFDLTIRGQEIKVLETPGHSPGGISLYWPAKKIVLTGDALFKRGVGRTDLPGSSKDELMNSLQSILLELSDETKVFPGHGPATTIGEERKTNPFLNQ